MVNIVCDSCGKIVSQPVLDVNFFNLEGREVCAPCNVKIKALAEKAQDSQRSFQLMNYKDSLKSTLRKVCK